MRTVLVTGPGGAGRTTIATATALATARRGGRVLLLSADPLDDLLGTAPGPPPGDRAPGRLSGPEPTEVTDGLWAARVDAGEHFRTEALAFQARVATGLDLLGARGLAGEELTELPGSAESALFQAVRRAADGDWDTLVVDLPPLPDALALLALPAQLRRYLRRLLPRERQAARALRPIMAQLAGVPMPSQRLYETADRWDTELASVQRLIEDPATTVRLVAEPGPAAARALRTARTALALHGLRVDTLVPNRTLPHDAAAPWLATLAAQQRKCLDEWHEEWAPETSLHPVTHLGRDPHGLDDLALLGTAPGAAGSVFRETAGGGVPDARTAAPGVFGGVPDAGTAVPGVFGGVPDAGTAVPGAVVDWPVEDRLAEENLLVWRIPLPGAVKSELNLVRRDDELLITVGPFRRIVPLPSALRRCTVTGAALTDGILKVRFTPDPALWPRGH